MQPVCRSKVASIAEIHSRSPLAEKLLPVRQKERKNKERFHEARKTPPMIVRDCKKLPTLLDFGRKIGYA